MKNDILYKIKSVVIGHAVGDALGLPAEFASRKELCDAPVTDMEGYGTYPYPPGTWSDDTSMALAALDSLANGKIDFDEIMGNFRKWLEGDAYTPSGECFDIGRTTVMSILNYFAHKKTADTCGMTDEFSNGNGSLMRIYPFVLFWKYGKSGCKLTKLVHKASALTHAHERSKIACGIYAWVLSVLLLRPSKIYVSHALYRARRTYQDYAEFHSFERIFDISGFYNLDESEIRSSGYVVDTLEAAIWCLINTNSYRECVLKAVNLGEDTDTVAAVAGSLAGALYGYDAIPEEWKNALLRREYIEDMCQMACECWKNRKYIKENYEKN